MNAPKTERVIHIRRRDNGEIVKTIRTEKVGSAYERMVDGLVRRVDFERFWIEEEQP